MTNETVESKWSGELGVPVDIREVEGWAEYDVYLDNVFMVTTISLETAEAYLERYAAVQDEVSA